MRSKKHLRTFLIDSGNQEIQRVLSVETDVKFLVIHFPLLFRHKTTHRALRHTSEQHVRCRAKQNGRQENVVPRPLTLAVLSDRAEMSSSGSGQNFSVFSFAHFHWLFIFTHMASRSLELFLMRDK